MRDGQENPAARNILVCDTTLRDGEQTCGVAFRVEEKVRIARLLDEMGVDCIDAGFPASSQADQEAVRGITALGLRARVVAFCRPNRAEIDLARSCGANAVYTFVPTSDVHMRVKFGGDGSEVRERLKREMADGVAYAKSLGMFVGCGSEDATRTPYDYLEEVLVLAQESGADLVGVADTVGSSTPDDFRTLVSRLRARISVLLSLHCHNDFGLATANTVAGILGGADEVQCTVNGIGERAGNASLEEVTVALTQLYGFSANVDLSRLKPMSDLIAGLSRIEVSPMKPIVGGNAFSHESGLHVSSVMRDPTAYEPLRPELVGHTRRIVIGKHSGKSIVSHVLDAHGLSYDDGVLGEVLREVKRVAVLTKSSVTEAQMVGIYHERIANPV
ncbi:LeuA family protein [Kitasatospora sp. NPDC056138]|uniref:LeuA family protein n=1 Tax=Kitasatospora sp. NPDC056138 TaxID=3345724 RepID=UPI0035DDC10B